MNKMFCYQCQETAKGTGCTTLGVCGKTSETSGLQDLLLYTEKGVAAYSIIFRKEGKAKELIKNKVNRYLINSLFITITNANFDDDAILDEIKVGLKLREELKALATDEEKKEAEKYGVDLEEITNPWHAAVSSFLSFSVGSLPPTLAILLFPEPYRIPVTVVVVALTLLLTGYISAKLGKAPIKQAMLRNLTVGLLTMLVTYVVGQVFHVNV